MTHQALLTLAEAPAPAPASPFGGMLGMLVPMLLIFGIFYFMLIRPQQRREKERKAMIDNIKSGDRILFAGGLLGTVTNIKEATFIVKIADNVKIEIARGAVSRVLQKDDKVEMETER